MPPWGSWLKAFLVSTCPKMPRDLGTMLRRWARRVGLGGLGVCGLGWTFEVFGKVKESQHVCFDFHRNRNHLFTAKSWTEWWCFLFYKTHGNQWTRWKPKVHVFPELWLVQALAFTSVLPWSICLLCYLILHWAFPYDRRILAEEKEVCLERHGGRLYSDSEGSDLSDNEDLLEYLDWAGAGNPVTAPALKLIIVSLCQSADRLRASDLCCCCQSSV